MSGIKQPVTQVRLTNVAVVRYKVKGHRYEIACYKNKVVSWRTGVETDIDEVLQSRHIFANVSKGVLAGDEQLMADFGTRDEPHIAKVILEKGEIQVSEKERAAALDALFRDIAVLVSDMCVSRDTRRPYPVRMIEQGMRDAHYSIRQQKSAKSQALAVIKLLQQSMPLDRAHMRVVITCEAATGKDLKKKLQPLAEKIEEENWGSAEYRVQLLLSPGNYRQVEELIAQQKGGRAHCEIIDLKVQEAAVGEEDGEEEDGEGHSDDEDDQPQPAPIIQPAARGASTAAITAKLAATNLNAQPAQQPAAAAAEGRSKKAMRKVLDEEDIRTVGERRDWEEESGDVETSSEVRQRQQQAARKAKKERKLKTTKKNAKHDDDDDEDDEAAAGKAKTKSKQAELHDVSEEGEDEEQASGAAVKVGKAGKSAKGGSALADGDDSDEAEFGTGKAKKEKKSRRKKKQPAVVGSVTSLQQHSDDED